MTSAGHDRHRGRRHDGARSAGVYIVWKGYQGRVDAMRTYFDLEPHYLGFSFGQRALRPLEYIAKALVTLAILIRHRPPEVWVQMPPTPPFYVASLFALLHRGTKVVADCHNAQLEPPWIFTPGIRRLLRRADVVVVHNAQAHRRALAQGLPESTLVLETRPAFPEPVDDTADVAFRHPWVLFPASFKADEPIDVLIEVARAAPDITFVLTGDARRGRAALAGAPDNIVTPGWVDKATYKAMLASCDLVIGLTLLEGVQLSGANEAVGFGKAMVLSDTALLRELFPSGAVYVGPGAEALLRGIRTALADVARLERESAALREERIRRWTAQADVVLAALRRRRSASQEAQSEPR